MAIRRIHVFVNSIEIASEAVESIELILSLFGIRSLAICDESHVSVYESDWNYSTNIPTKGKVGASDIVVSVDKEIPSDVVEEAKRYNIPVFYIPLGDSSSDTFKQCIGVCKRLLG